MKLTVGQITLLLAGGIFFALQFLPHRVTSLQNTPLAFFYLLSAILLTLVIMISGLVAFAMWVSTRDDESKRLRRDWCITFLLMLVLAVGVTLSGIVYASGLPVGSFVNRFDREIWALPTSSQFVSGDITPRQKMLGDVVRNVVLNKTKEEIISALGSSEDAGYFASSGRDLIYGTGPQRDSFLSIDSEWLLIWFGPDGRTSRYEIWSD